MSKLGRLIGASKLYWGLIAIFAIGAMSSPISSKGNNIFLSSGNLLDVLRQVSTTGLIATGMTAVIITAGIDLSVGSLMAIGSVVCAMLLTVPGFTPAAGIGLPVTVATGLLIGASAVMFLRSQLARPDKRGSTSVVLPIALGAILSGALLLWLMPQMATGFGVLAVLIVTPCVCMAFGAINGLVIVVGRLQPFIVTLAMMVTALGVARLTAGQNNAVLPVYPGSNSVQEFELLRSLMWGVVPVPVLVFLSAIAIYGMVLRLTPFGRYVYAIGGNEEAARLSGIPVERTKVIVYAISGLLAGLAAVLYVAQYRQGKPDAGAGLELDAIAAVVIGGTSLMGGRGSLAGTFCGVVIFGMLSNILQLHNINSNLQLVLIGLIIVGTVLVQERSGSETVSHFASLLRVRRGGAVEERPQIGRGSRNMGGEKK